MHVSLYSLWSPYGIAQTIIFLPCGFFLFSSPNLSRRRLDVCHASTHGVALVRISDAGLKRSARASLEMQDTKSRQKRHLGTIAQLCQAIYSQIRHVSTIGKKPLKQQCVLHTSHNMVNFGPLAAEIGPVVWGTPANFNGFASWQRYCTAVK